MDEHDFEALRSWKPFSSDAVKTAERLPALALALFGRTPEYLRRQLLAGTPKIPPGCTLADLKLLERQTKVMLEHPSKFGWFANEAVVIGSQSRSSIEARCEIVRRAIEHLERRG